MKTAVYPGSFDPFTVGHLDVLKRACTIFDMVYISVLCNSEKKPSFTPEERMKFIIDAVAAEGIPNVIVGKFNGLLVDYAKQVGATHIVRGLRAVSDFEYEFKFCAMSRKLEPDIDMIYLMTSTQNSFLSSSMVKEVASYGGNISGLVPEVNEKIIAERLLKK